MRLNGEFRVRKEKIIGEDRDKAMRQVNWYFIRVGGILEGLVRKGHHLRSRLPQVKSGKTYHSADGITQVGNAPSRSQRNAGPYA